MIDPDDAVFLNPEDATEAVAKYIIDTNQPEVDSADVGQIARIVFESLAFKYRYVFDKLAQATDKKIDVV